MTVLQKLLTAGLPAVGLMIAAWANPTLNVTPDERVDLVSIVFHYAGNREYGKIFIPEYARAMEIQFADVKEHPVIGMAREFHDRYGVSYNAIANLALRLTSTESMQLKAETLDSLDPRWPRERLGEFLKQLRDFARQSKFSEFYAAQAPLYRTQCEFWQNRLEQSQAASWAKRFYGETRPLHFTVIPSALENGGVGPALEMDGEFYCYMVSMVFNSEMRRKIEAEPGAAESFEMRISSFLAHEFSHPWTNPVANAIYPQIQATAEKIFPTLQEAMKRQSYGTPRTMMIEMLNRAAELVYLHDRYGKEKAERHLAVQKANGFLLTERLFRCILAEREKGGASWRFSDGARAYIDCINADESLQLLHSLEIAIKNAPSLVSISPENGAKNVDPATTELVITFSKPMTGMAICMADSGIPPQFISAAYDDSRTVLTVEVQLKPDSEYRLWLNRNANKNFASSDGGVLPDTEYVFYTGPAR